jgi:outer membrane protein OmpA-like peptidoglycan-associated protein
MSKKRVILGICSLSLAAVFATGCHAEAKIGNPEVKAATPPPPPAEPPPPAPEPPQAVEPPPAPKALGRVSVQGNKIEITEQVQFDKSGATIKPESAGLLDEIAKTIKENDAKIKKVEVAGHTSAEGDAAANMKLSAERAAAVMKALTERGIDKSKLVAKGYGITKPIGDNSDAGGRVKNRRVEFTILDK